MCGIVGMFGIKDAPGIVVEGMKLISYRGRDGYGICYGSNPVVKCANSEKIDFECLEGDFALGHCLHSVVNMVQQPFYGEGIFAVNSEIYNWQKLNEEYGLNARNDAELFFKLLEKFSVERVLQLLDGDYAGAYVKEKKVYLFRDRIGVKPLWYSLENGLVFSSERKVLRKLGYENVFELNPREILVYDLIAGESSFSALNFYELKK